MERSRELYSAQTVMRATRAHVKQGAVLRRSLLITIALASVIAAGASPKIKKPKFERSFPQWRDYLLGIRRYETIPVRREWPFREFGPTAAEVEQMQSAAATAIPKAIIYIGPVVAGCPCENGPKCKAEVWVDGYLPGRIEGILLSQVDGTWTIGTIQNWWLERRRLERKGARYFEILEYDRHFPACDSELRKMLEERFGG